MQSLVVFSHGSIPKSCWFKVLSILKQRSFPFSRHEIEGKPLDQGYVAYLLNQLHTFFFFRTIFYINTINEWNPSHIKKNMNGVHETIFYLTQSINGHSKYISASPVDKKKSTLMHPN